MRSSHRRRYINFPRIDSVVNEWNFEICLYTMREQFFVSFARKNSWTLLGKNDLTRFQVVSLSFVLITSKEFLLFSGSLLSICNKFAGPNLGDGFISFLFVFKWGRLYVAPESPGRFAWLMFASVRKPSPVAELCQMFTIKPTAVHDSWVQHRFTKCAESTAQPMPKVFCANKQSDHMC